MASLEVVFRSEARADVAEAAAFYEQEDDGRLVPRFLYAVQKVIEHISSYPRASPIHYRNTRRLLLNTFPYWVHYRILGDTVEIFGVLHSKRGPAFVRKRAK